MRPDRTSLCEIEPVAMTAIGETRPVVASALATRDGGVKFLLAHAHHAEVYPISAEEGLRLAAILTAAAGSATIEAEAIR